MNGEMTNNNQDMQNVKDECKKYLNFHIVLTTTDGKKYDGIIQSVDENGVNMLTGEETLENDTSESNGGRQYYHDNDHYPRRRYRHFRPRYFPLHRLAAISLLPYIAPPIYPYYPFY